MRKIILFVLVTAICMSVLTACSTPVSAPASTIAATQSASPSASPSATATPSASPVVSASASASPDASATASDTSDDPGYTLENIIKEDSLNKNYQNTPVPGETIKVTIVRNTLTFDVTLDKNIKPADFTADMQAKYKQDLQSQISMLSDEYDGLTDCTFIYNLMDKSGAKLMTLTQDFKYQG